MTYCFFFLAVGDLGCLLYLGDDRATTAHRKQSQMPCVENVRSGHLQGVTLGCGRVRIRKGEKYLLSINMWGYSHKSSDIDVTWYTWGALYWCCPVEGSCILIPRKKQWTESQYSASSFYFTIWVYFKIFYLVSLSVSLSTKNMDNKHICLTLHNCCRKQVRWIE